MFEGRLLRHVIVCEDVRREASGKEMLIGVYSGGIRFTGPSPGKLRILFFRFEFEQDPSEFEGEIKFEMVSPSGTPVIRVAQPLKLNKTTRTIYAIGNENFVLYEAGSYELRVGLDAEPERVDTVEVSFGATLSSPS